MVLAKNITEIPNTGVIHGMSAGTIPLQLSQLHNLELLDLGGNFLTGELRHSLWWFDESYAYCSTLQLQALHGLREKPLVTRVVFHHENGGLWEATVSILL